MRVLLIVQRGLTIDKEFLADQANTIVTQNSVPSDVGVAIWTCGQPDPPFEWAETIIQIGECLMEGDMQPDTVINAQDDFNGQLVSMVQTLQDSEIEVPDTE